MNHTNQAGFSIISGSDYAVRVETHTTGIIGARPDPKSTWVISTGKLITTTVTAEIRFKQEQQ